ncbi:alginate lyase [Altererythrobacter sp. RZ02]|uniref:Alginate lyase n=1 Tax=Pontixanthobacter rizhaonensis TaxID=2730337 RepID=A0A848QMA2_9SPHN|nr:polysaccharide lyase 6 family protein [Pontixanthobacter rizhaonensis]NMW31989.1 alginate lyase [Pontixanthobacter rizhaonensis]
MFARLGLFIVLLLVQVTPASAERYLVKTQAEYFAAAEAVKAGDSIVLADGVWDDFEIVLSAKGTVNAPIHLTAQTPGAVKITGQSNLRIGGEFIVVKGLVFTDGFSPTGEVISFRRSKTDLANNSRVTEIVIDGFSKPDRYETDYWVGMYGKNNRFDHSFLAGKTNKGVTFAVRLDSPESQENGHRIDHNYFGHRPVLGSNGGETLRVGTSKYSMFNSNTVIANNYFERTDGEVEIISIKAGANIVRGNVFDASRGALTLRHGDGNIIERNVFFGRGKDHTGGIRVINGDQTVRDNYMEGLRGNGFSSALTVMNGVPNSPVNRYVQVSNARIDRNTILDSRRITLGAGADEERSAPPVDSTFSRNLLSSSGAGTFIEVDADISGIEFSDNRLLSGKVHSALAALMPVNTELARADNGLLYPVDPELFDVGVPRDLDPVSREATGPAWYPKPDGQTAFGSGKVIAVAPGEGTIEAALKRATSGDTLHLAAGDYIVNKTIFLDFPLTISGANGAVVNFARPSLFEMAEGGSLRLHNLTISGRDAPDNVGNSVVRTTSSPIRGNFVIELDQVAVTDLTVNRNFDVIVIGKSAFADAVTIKNSAFNDVTGVVVKANAETEDYGQYGIEYTTITGSAFSNIGKSIANIYRGGRDESTFGPHFTLSSSSLSGVGGKDAPALVLHGAQITEIDQNSIAASGPIKIVHTVGAPSTVISNNVLDSADGIVVEELNYSGDPRAVMRGNIIPKGAKQ